MINGGGGVYCFTERIRNIDSVMHRLSAAGQVIIVKRNYDGSLHGIGNFNYFPGNVCGGRLPAMENKKNNLKSLLTDHIQIAFLIDKQEERHKEFFKVLACWKSKYVDSVNDRRGMRNI